MSHNKLRGRIVELYGSVTKFSKAINTSAQTANAKVAGKTGFSRDDIVAWSEALNISNADCYEFFIE